MYFKCIEVFSIPLYYDSPETFSKKLKKKFENEIKDFNPKHYRTDEERNKTLEFLRANFSSRYPEIHKYNNILGYAELVLDWNDVLIYFYLNGDNRKRYNKNKNSGNRNNKNAIFFPTGYYYGGKFNFPINSEFRLAFKKALVNIEKLCKVWRVFVDTKYYADIIEYFDFEGYLRQKTSNDKENH